MEDQKYVVSLPEFGPYAHTHGTTYDEALRQGRQYLREHNQERDDQEPLSNEEIDLVCSFLTKRRLSRRLETEKQKVFISDDFNAPLPDDIINLFYQ
jgi:predicted RNase H-like HicB family nuclease